MLSPSRPSLEQIHSLRSRMRDGSAVTEIPGDCAHKYKELFLKLLKRPQYKTPACLHIQIYANF